MMDLDINTIDADEYIKCTEIKINELANQTQLIKDENFRHISSIQVLKEKLREVETEIEIQLEESCIHSQVIKLRKKLIKINDKINIAKQIIQNGKKPQVKNRVKEFKIGNDPYLKTFFKIN